MWKSLLVIVLAIPLAILFTIIFWVGMDWKAGVIAGCVTLALCLTAATLMLFFLKTFSVVDVFLPLIFSIVWSLALIPLSFSAEVFSAPTTIGAGLVLTLCLWRVRQNNGQGKNWLIFPIIVYIYEMLPVNIPGPFDDMFAFGGDVVCVILFYSSSAFHRQLPEGFANSGSGNMIQKSPGDSSRLPRV
jgi:uncharacterized membrane protein